MSGGGPSFNSDLAAERHKADLSVPGVEFSKESRPLGSWERIKISSKAGEISIGRPCGHYDTLTVPRMDLLCEEGIGDVTEEVARELCVMCEAVGISPDRILVVGLGNPELTPDSIGVEAARIVEATRQIREFDNSMFDALECSEISVLIPGVASSSGLDASDVTSAVAARIRPDLVIAVDSLAAASPKRLGTTVQFCDTGIHPGSGIGAGRRAIDSKSVLCPVIAIGVPTVIDSRLLIDGDKDPRGTVGMLVCPKEIDVIAKVAGKIIGTAINQAFGITY
jgi:spore protease